MNGIAARSFACPQMTNPAEAGLYRTETTTANKLLLATTRSGKAKQAQTQQGESGWLWNGCAPSRDRHLVKTDSTICRSLTNRMCELHFFDQLRRCLST